jgi:ADP-ribose pyrophosphatase
VSAFKLSEDEQRDMEERKRRRTVLAPLRPKTPAPHKDARSQQNPRYPKRSEVPDDRVPWSTPWDNYNPIEWTDEYVLTKGIEQGWADLPDAIPLRDELIRRKTFCGPTPDVLCPLEELPDAFDEFGRPRNPRGRTGMRGRGLLGKWGPNHAADPIVTRLHPSTRKLQVVAIQRKDTGAWALPGGMVDAGEVVSQTVRREFTEEAGNLESESSRAKQELLLDKIFCESNRRAGDWIARAGGWVARAGGWLERASMQCVVCGRRRGREVGTGTHHGCKGHALSDRRMCRDG